MLLFLRAWDPTRCGNITLMVLTNEVVLFWFGFCFLQRAQSSMYWLFVPQNSAKSISIALMVGYLFINFKEVFAASARFRLNPRPRLHWEHVFFWVFFEEVLTCAGDVQPWQRSVALRGLF